MEGALAWVNSAQGRIQICPFLAWYLLPDIAPRLWFPHQMISKASGYSLCEATITVPFSPISTPCACPFRSQPLFPFTSQRASGNIQILPVLEDLTFSHGFSRIAFCSVPQREDLLCLCKAWSIALYLTNGHSAL